MNPKWKMSGEWDIEPDRKQFVHAEFNCLILRRDLGHLCAYVQVPTDHPLHGVSDSVAGYGALTFAGDLPGECGWWLGMDYAHCGDLVPAMYPGYPGDVYRNMEYVMGEARRLAEWVSTKSKPFKSWGEQDLWDVQLQQFPDSVRFSRTEILRAWMCNAEGYVTANPMFLTSVLSAVLQHPEGVFYTCHAGKDYGLRYGKEGSEYCGFHKGTAQPTRVIRGFDTQTRTMWYVMGIPQTWYDTKLRAERAARLEFPNEDPDKRYARVGYREFLED